VRQTLVLDLLFQPQLEMRNTLVRFTDKQKKSFASRLEAAE
jgi:hypothetical protein